MAAPTFDRDRAVRILLDAIDMGDRQAAAQWKISERTIRSYRERMANDPELAAACQQKKKEMDGDWRRERDQALCLLARKMGQLAKDATIKDLRHLAGAYKILSDSQLADEILHDEQSGADREGEPPAPPAGQSPGATPPVH